MKYFRSTLVYTFFSIGHKGLQDILVKIIDKAVMWNLMNKEGIGSYELNTLNLNGLNLRMFL